MGIFMAGLKEEVQAEVGLFGPQSLEHMMTLAQNIETKNWALNGSQRPNSTTSHPRPTTQYQNFNRRPFTPHSTPNQNGVVNEANKTTTVTYTQSEAAGSNSWSTPDHLPLRRNGGFERLSPAELQAKIDKGLCFRCDEKYGPNHICRNRQLRVMLMHTEEEEDDLQDVRDEPEPQSEEEEVELSTNSMVGINSPRTMKLRGAVYDEEVVVLIDCGATHNFISQPLVDKLKLPVTEKGFQVTLGDGQHVKGQGLCRQVQLHIPPVTVIQDFLPFNLGNVDVILGVE